MSPVLWLPLEENTTPDTRRRNYVLIARLADGTTLDRAQQEADRSQILAMVGRDALRLSVFGVGLGVVGALAASRGLESQLLGVTASDPSTYALLAIGLTLVGLLASLLPALRATRVDPVVALRSE